MPSSTIHLSKRTLYVVSICLTLLAFVSLRASRQNASAAPAPVKAPNYFNSTNTATDVPSEQSTKTNIADQYGKLPLSFEINEGQTDQQVRFLSRGPGYDLFLTPTEAVFNLRRPQAQHSDKFGPAVPREGISSVTEQKTSILRLKMISANDRSRVDGEDELPGKINYFIGNDPGNWRVNIPTYRKVHYKQIYADVDLIYYGNRTELEYDFVISPGGSVKAVKFQFEGADKIALDDAGNLRLATKLGDVQLRKPVIYQMTEEGGRREVRGGYVLRGHEIGFSVQSFDKRKPLIIDPVLSYSTLLGTGGGEQGNGIAVDSQGNAYITGITSAGIFPTTPGAFQTTGSFGGAFVTKLDATGSNLIYSTYLAGVSGNGSTIATGVAVDGTGNAYVTGYTSSADFPTISPLRGGRNNLLITTDGGGNWSPSNVGTANRAIQALAIDKNSPSTIYAGTGLNGGIFKSNDGGASWTALNTELVNASCPAIVIDPTASNIVYAALIAQNFGSATGVYKSTDAGNTWISVSSGLNATQVTALGIDPQNHSTLYAGGNFALFKSTNGGTSWVSSSNGLNFGGFTAIVVDPNTPTTIYATAGGGGVFKTTNGAANWSQVNNGLTSTTVRALIMDPNATSTLYAGTPGGIFKTTDSGATWSAINNGSLSSSVNVGALAIAPTSNSTIFAATGDGRVMTTVNSGGVWSTSYSTTTNTSFRALVIDPNMSSKVIAGADSQNASLGSPDAFITKLNSSGSALVYSTLIGGVGDDEANGIAVDQSGNAYIAGLTTSSDYPSVNAAQATFGGGQNCGDAFVTKLNASGSAISFSTFLGGTACDLARAVALDTTGNVYITGQTASANLATAGAFQTTVGASGDAFVARYANSGALSYVTYLGGEGTDTGYGIAADSSGNAYITGVTTSSSFPTANPIQATNAGSFGDAFVTKLNSAGSALIYSTFLGGSDIDGGRGIAIDSAGNAYVTGFTNSSEFPLTPGALRTKSPFFKTIDGGNKWNNDNYGLKSTIVTTFGINPLTPSTVFAGTRNAVYRSADAGRNWTLSMSGLVTPSITSFAINPTNPSIMYLSSNPSGFGGSSSGVFKSTDGGNNWHAANNGFPNVSAIYVVIDPLTPSTLYAGTGFSLYKSTDSGDSWTGIGPQFFSSVVLVIDPFTPTTLYSADNNSGGKVSKSTDGGATWQELSIPSSGISFLAIDPVTASTVYAAGFGNGLFKTTNGGASWTLLNSMSGSIAIDPLSPSTLYLGGSSGVSKSTNGGSKWITVNNGLRGQFISCLAINPANSSVYAGGTAFTPEEDAFVTKISASGTSLVYSTLLGGEKAATNSSPTNDEAHAIAVDATGNAYITGLTSSVDFPADPNSYQPFNRGGSDAFVSKLTSSYIISGQVLDTNNAPVSGAQVILNDGSSLTSTVTEGDGSYQFLRLREGGNFTVSASKPHFTMAPASQTFINLSGNQVQNFVATATNAPFFNISGQITNNGSGLSGVSVTLSGSQQNIVTTDSNGNYSFTLAGGGSYTVTPSILGFTFSPTNQTFNNLGADQTADFSATRQNFVVTNANDHGPGSLRQAMLDANASQGLDTINFNIPGSGVHTINLLLGLPIITDPVIIDATTQPGYTGSPLIELNGLQAGSSAFGFQVTAGGSTIRGFAIGGFTSNIGIYLSGNGGNIIQGNYVGIDATGTVARSNNGGIQITNSSTNNLIGGTTLAARNVISGNGFTGIFVGGSGNQIQGNFIGTNGSGTAAIPNGTEGVDISGSPQFTNNVIGGTAPGAGNLISGNPTGVYLLAAGNTVQGNLIGTDVTGLHAVPNNIGINAGVANTLVGGLVPGARNVISGNNGDGVDIGGAGTFLQGNFIGTDITGTACLGNGGSGAGGGTGLLIGGTTPEARNIISCNGGFGNVSPASSNPAALAVVQGNYIGTDVTGNVALNNPSAGVSIQGSNTLIGGLTPGSQNIVAGNKVGIQLGGSVAPGPVNSTIQGNIIGLNAAGTAPLPNTFGGIQISDSSNNVIGGVENGAANKIVFNGGPGVTVFSGTRNAVRGNSIFSNNGLGIDLNGNGVTPNDNCDTDSGANNLQNFPVITSASADSLTTTVQGTLNSTAGTQFRIDFYSNATCDPSGNGEGQTFLGSTNVTTDAACSGTFTFSVANGSVSGTIITATATDPNNNTSEFSKCATVLPSIQFGTASYTVNEGTPRVNITLTRMGDASAAFSVNYATIDSAGLQNCNVFNGIASPRCDYINTVGTMSFAPGETSKSFSVAIIDDSYAEGNETFTVSLNNPSGATLGAQSTATVTIIDNDVTNGPNPIDGTDFFVRQQYLDFLGREPDPPGFAGWANTINNCSGDTTQCDRIHVSQLFFQSAEFQDRGYFVYRFYPVAFGRKPDYGEFVPDLASVSGFLDANQLETAKVAFINAFMARTAFVNTYNSLSNQEYVDALLNTAGVTLSSRQAMIDGLNNSTMTRGQVLRPIVESTEVSTKYNHQAYAVMEYFGYLRRQPDAFYLQWIQVLDSTNDPRGMVTGFVTSQEYRNRFGP